MRTLIVTVLLTSVALVGCKKKTPTDKTGTQGLSGKTKSPAAMGAMKPALTPEKRPAPRPAVSTKPPPITGSKPVAGLERAAFVPADAVAYGSFDSQRVLTAAKPIITLFVQLQADSSRSSAPKASVKGRPKLKIKTTRKPPKYTYDMLVTMAKKKYRLDATKLGRVTVLGIVPPPRPKHKSAFFAEPVFLAEAAAYTPPKTPPVEKMGSVGLYAITGRPTRSRIAVVGKTVIFGETATVKKVLAARLGETPRIGAAASLVRTLNSLRAGVPKATSFMVVDISALRKKITRKLGAWEKELESGGLFFTDKRLVVLVKGKPERIALAATLLKVMLAQAQKALPMAQKQLIKAAGPEAGKLFDGVKFALKNANTKSKGDTLTIGVNASPVKVMTAVGMLTYFMLARGGEKSVSAPKSASDHPPKAMPKPKAADKPRPVKAIRVK